MRYVVGVVCWYAVVGLTAQAGEIDAKKIVGTWQLQPDGPHITFGKDGKLSVVHKKDGEEVKIGGSYELKKNKITVNFEKDGKTQTKKGTVEKLTAETLVIRDEKDTDRAMEFKRVK